MEGPIEGLDELIRQALGRNRVEILAAYLPGMDVALIRWPSDESLRVHLAQEGHPRLLLVEPEAEPPICVDVLEDWVRLPVSHPDRNARIKSLEEKAGRLEIERPIVHHGDMLEYHGAIVQLSEIQGRLIRSFISRFGGVVRRAELTTHAWPGVDASANNLDVAIGRLRRQIEPAGLRIVSVRSRGYLLCSAERPG